MSENKNQAESKGLGKMAVKSMASLARNIVIDGIDGRCWLFMHKPEEPKDLAKRLQAMKNK